MLCFIPKRLLLLAVLAQANVSVDTGDALPAQNFTDSMLDNLADKLVDKLAGKFVNKLVGHLSVAPRTNVGRTLPRPSSWVGHSPRLQMDSTVGRQQVRANAGLFNFGQKKKEPDPPLLISQDYKLAGGTVLTTAALAAVKAPIIFPLFFGALGALLTIQSGRVVFAFDDKAFEVRIGSSSTGETTDSGENFAVGGENRWNYNTFTRWNFIPSESFPLFVYFYETQTNGAKDEQFHLFPVIMNSAELSSAMKERVGEDKIAPITFGEVVEGAKSADRVG
eukprot:gnl/MRDRNA2_/MRDRNA2_89498_c0_seq1.p1 gnl/MRDRNA2_/MRDRNA2_89498_c0~~gnl/MRDRNA2_/MRDRNA2_89498_c0_seq1.p1  ORF type:complete len:279 (-),score=34.50 gnl/MRDRNA2_/MRDRNA2_89498_c0_seq1:196-1032(-)